MSEENDRHQWDRRCDLLARIELSTLYHRKRELFLSRWDRVIKGIAVLGGSAAVARIGGDDWLPWIGAAIAVTSTAGLVGGLADRARKHSELAASFKLLESEIAGKGEHGFSEEDVDGWTARLHSIETDEPPALSALVRICQNQQAWARGAHTHVYKITWYERCLAQYVDFQSTRLEPMFPPEECAPAK